MKGCDFLLVTLNQRVVKIKFYLNQTAQNIIEIGKELAAAKNEVPHGNWQNWLQDNFKLSQMSASRFIRAAERFAKLNDVVNFQPSQMFELLALPESETQNFLAEKAAQGTPVAEMTIKTLREEVAKFKADFQTQKAKVENLFAENEELRAENDELYKTQKGLRRTLEDTRAKVDERVLQINKLQQQLKNQPSIEIIPADYESTKRELAALKAAEVEMIQRMDVFQKLSTVASLMQDIIQSPSLAGVQDFKREYPEEFWKMCAAFLDFTDSFYEE